MAMIDDIMAQLQSMGINVSGGFTGLPDISGFNISQALQGQYGLTEQQLPPSMFQGISSDLIKGGLAGTYSPQVQATGQTLMDKMLTQAQGKVGKQAFGGFAGSGQQQQYAGGIKDVYSKNWTTKGSIDKIGTGYD